MTFESIPNTIGVRSYPEAELAEGRPGILTRSFSGSEQARIS